MKRILKMGVILLLIGFSLTGCSESNDPICDEGLTYDGNYCAKDFGSVSVTSVEISNVTPSEVYVRKMIDSLDSMYEEAIVSVEYAEYFTFVVNLDNPNNVPINEVKIMNNLTREIISVETGDKEDLNNDGEADNLFVSEFGNNAVFIGINLSSEFDDGKEISFSIIDIIYNENDVKKYTDLTNADNEATIKIDMTQAVFEFIVFDNLIDIDDMRGTDEGVYVGLSIYNEHNFIFENVIVEINGSPITIVDLSLESWRGNNYEPNCPVGYEENCLAIIFEIPNDRLYPSVKDTTPILITPNEWESSEQHFNFDISLVGLTTSLGKILRPVDIEPVNVNLYYTLTSDIFTSLINWNIKYTILDNNNIEIDWSEVNHPDHPNLELYILINGNGSFGVSSDGSIFGGDLLQTRDNVYIIPNDMFEFNDERSGTFTIVTILKDTDRDANVFMVSDNVEMRIPNNNYQAFSGVPEILFNSETNEILFNWNSVAEHVLSIGATFSVKLQSNDLSSQSSFETYCSDVSYSGCAIPISDVDISTLTTEQILGLGDNFFKSEFIDNEEIMYYVTVLFADGTELYYTLAMSNPLYVEDTSN